MKLAAITFWREMPIVVTFLLLAMVYFVAAKDTDLRSSEKNNWNHRYYAKDTEMKFSPRFKHPSKMFIMEMKPVGSSVKLKCTAEGNPTPNITWYKNKITPIQRTYFQPSYSKWSMSLDELTKADNGNYTCVVCNELDCIEHSVALHIQDRYPSKPYIKEGYPGNITVLVNETVQLHCPLISDLEPYVYWTRLSEYSAKDAETVPSDMSLPIEDVIESDNPNDKIEQLTIYNVTKEDEGWYVCVALNSLGNTTAKGYLTVLELTPSTTSPTIPVNTDNTTIPANAEHKATPTIDDENAKLMKTLKEMFDEFSKEQDKRLQEIRHSIDVMSAKYDDFYAKINCIEKERLEDKKTFA